MALLLKPPAQIFFPSPSKKTLFLAGSIEMGVAENWQDKVWNQLKLEDDLTIYNPRRDDFQPEAEQSPNNPYFYEQVQWEQDALAMSKVVLFNFVPSTKSPITLMELGYELGTLNSKASAKHLVVCCPDGFWRQANVEIMLKRSRLFMFRNLDAALFEVRRMLSYC